MAVPDDDYIALSSSSDDDDRHTSPTSLEHSPPPSLSPPPPPARERASADIVDEYIPLNSPPEYSPLPPLPRPPPLPLSPPPEYRNTAYVYSSPEYSSLPPPPRLPPPPPPPPLRHWENDDYIPLYSPEYSPPPPPPPSRRDRMATEKGSRDTWRQRRSSPRRLMCCHRYGDRSLPPRSENQRRDDRRRGTWRGRGDRGRGTCHGRGDPGRGTCRGKGERGRGKWRGLPRGFDSDDRRADDGYSPRTRSETRWMEMSPECSLSPSPHPSSDRRRSPPPACSKKSWKDDRRRNTWHGSPRDSDDQSKRRMSDNLNQTSRKHLISFKKFVERLEDDTLPAEAENRYLEYCLGYISAQKRAYFEAHKDEEWLQDKYHPTNLITVVERRKERARATAQEFLLDLKNGVLDLGPSLTVSSNISVHDSYLHSKEEPKSRGETRKRDKSPTKETELSSGAPEVHPVSSEPRRIQVDIEQTQALVLKLDAEKGIEGNDLCNKDYNKLKGVELLDTLIIYLWRIHGLDYYDMFEADDTKGLQHVRTGSKDHTGSDISGDDWENMLDSYWQKRLSSQDPLEIMTAREKIDASSVGAYVRIIRVDKNGWMYGCGVMGCDMIFLSVKNVHKHLRLRHTLLMADVVSKVCNDIYLQNYMNDADAPVWLPVLLQSALKRKAKQWRSLPDTQLRDGWGGHRERDWADRVDGEGRYSYTEKIPFRDIPASSGGLEPKKDAYGAQRSCGLLQFPPYRFLPLVLVPVPGAGPLGPFVPAPPEGAMGMLGEQNGISSFTGSGDLWNGYEDLDDLQPEVTVTDYRTL